jgi:hypothetical protein
MSDLVAQKPAMIRAKTEDQNHMERLTRMSCTYRKQRRRNEAAVFHSITSGRMQH